MHKQIYAFILNLMIVFSLILFACSKEESSSLIITLTPDVKSGPFAANINVSMSANLPDATIYYTVDPDSAVSVYSIYSKPVPLFKTTRIKYYGSVKVKEKDPGIGGVVGQKKEKEIQSEELIAEFKFIATVTPAPIVTIYPTNPVSLPTAVSTVQANATPVPGNSTATPAATSVGTAGPATIPANSPTPVPTASPAPAFLTTNVSYGAYSASYGSTADTTITLTNSGGSPATSIVWSNTTSAPWSNVAAGTTCGATLVVGASCNYILRFTSPGEGSFNKTASISYNNSLQVATATANVSITGLPVSVTMEDVYPSNGKWNDYVKYADSGSDVYHQVDTICDGTEEYVKSCIHGGEKKKVIIAALNSCNGLYYGDQLLAFNWTCVVESGKATFYMQGLKDSKTMASILNATSWKNNIFSVGNGSYTLYATPNNTPWWTNTVQALPANAGGARTVLNSASTIYTLSANANTRGYLIGANKVGIVTLSTAVLTWETGGASWCDFQVGSDSGAYRCVVSADNKLFVWVEGKFAGAGNDVTLLSIGRSKHSVYRNLTLSDNHSIPSLASHTQAHSNLFYNIRVAQPDSGNSGILYAGTLSVFSNIVVSGAADSGIEIQGVSNVLTNSISASNHNYGVFIQATNNTITHLTAANNGQAGLYVNRSDLAIVQTVFIGNLYGLYLSSASNSKIANIATSQNNQGIMSTNCSNNNYSYNLLSGGNWSQACWVTGGTNPGVANGTCANNGSSSATVNTGINLALTFKAGISTTDSNNTTNTNGLSDFASLTDWVNFESRFRVWGKNATGFPSSSNNDVCSNGGGQCQIYDWRIKSTDTNILKKSNDGTTTNSAFTAGAACPIAVVGTNVITDNLDQNGSTNDNTFLVNALEIFFDGKGDDDGLCESGEACVYSPNFGAYQGSESASLIGPCTFTNGDVTGITMYGRSPSGE